MKTITINVSEPTYRYYQRIAKQRDRKTSELIREAMEHFAPFLAEQRQSILLQPPVSVGKIIKPLSPKDDLLEEMLGPRQ